MSKYLIDDQPLIVLPKLAENVGLNESLFLQQVHYWLLQKRHIKDGYYWTYNSYPEWLKQFPFWSESTLKRTVTSLENKGLIITGNYNSMKIDKTKWYRIDYLVLKEITKDIEEFTGKASNDESVQNDTTNGSKCTDEDVDMNRPIPETTTKTTTKKKEIKDIVSQDDTYPYERIIDYLNRRVGSRFDWKGKEVQSLIKARFKEGAKAEDFKIVIDKKWKQWHNDAKMVKYLRPKTLFAKSKFNEYLGEAELINDNKIKKTYEKVSAAQEMLNKLKGENVNEINRPEFNQLVIPENVGSF